MIDERTGGGRHTPPPLSCCTASVNEKYLLCTANAFISNICRIEQRSVERAAQGRVDTAGCLSKGRARAVSVSREI